MNYFPIIILFYLAYAGSAGFFLYNILVQGRQRRLDWIVALMLMLFLSMILIRITHISFTHQTGEIVTWFDSFSGILPNFIAILFYIFCQHFPRGTQGKRVWIVATLFTLVSIGFIPFYFSDQYIYGQKLVNGWYHESYGPYLIYAACWRLVINLSGLGVLAYKYFKLPLGLDKFQIRFFVFGALLCFITMEGFEIFHSYFSSQYIRYYRALVHLNILALLGTAIYTLVMHRGFDLQGATFKWLVKFIISFGLGFLVYGCSFLFSLGTGEGPLAWSVILLAVLVFVGFMFLFSNLQPKVDRLFFGKAIEAEEVILHLFYQKDFAANFGVQLSEVMQRFHGCFPIKQAFLLARDRFDAAHVHFENVGALHLQEIQKTILPKLHALTGTNLEAFEPFDRVLSVQELSQAPDRNLEAIVQKNKLQSFAAQLHGYGFRFLLPLTYGRQVMGYLVLGDRLNERPYYRRDLILLDAVRRAMALFLSNFAAYEELQVLKERAEAGVKKLSKVVSKQQKEELNLQGGQNLFYQSAVMKDLLHSLKKFSEQDQALLITGETGTGKELMARVLHESRAKHPFIAVNCAALTESLWENEIFGHAKGAFTDARQDYQGSVAQAGKGILFFDEIGEMSLNAQAKLLRLLQEKKYRPVGSTKELQANCRFIFATNRDLASEVAAGNFREDLYYRINVLHIQVPPLRERQEDIPLLVEEFIKKYAPSLATQVEGITSEAMKVLSEHNWPGNVRELENTLISAMASCENSALDCQDFHLSRNSSKTSAVIHSQSSQKEAIQLHGDYETIVDAYARNLISAALRESKDNKTKAAKLLGMKREGYFIR